MNAPHIPDPMKNAADVATMVATFYNHLTIHSIPDSVAEQLTLMYMTKMFDFVIATHQIAAAKVAEVDYTSIREFIVSAIREQQHK